MNNPHQNIALNPFPGLRPFSINESHLFFGREGQSETILSYLSEYKFAAITGASGSGKSSLIYCGIVPLLYGGFIPEAGSNWQILTSRPGSTPVWNLAASLAEAETELKPKTSNEGLVEYYYSVLRRHSLGLVDAVKQLKLPEKKNILIVIDQFEELFRYKESRNQLKNHRDEPDTFIRLLVNTAQQTNLPIYIIITMRSDFVGDCSEFQGLTALINKSNYLVPQMTRSDFKKVITGPINVAGASLEPRLLQHILNSLDESHDQLPVLQHAMMRTWEFWRKHNDPESSITMRDYLAAGKIDNALSLHANEAYIELNDSERQLCKTIFKALTEKGQEGKGIRRPASVFEIATLANAQPKDVIKVLEKFREPARSFLTPYHHVEITNDTVIDISHESLMRVWDKLKDWVDEEASSSQMYLRMVELSNLYQMGRTSLMRPPDLHLAINWKKTQNPNRAWAKRYHPAFEKAMVFLNASEKKFQTEEESKIKFRKRELNRTRRIAVIMSVFAVFLLMAMFYAYFQREAALDQKDTVEKYARILEAQKDTAIELSQLREYELILERDMVDSLNKTQQLQIVQNEETEISYQQKLEELSQMTETLEKTAAQERAEKQQALTEAEIAQQNISQSEAGRILEKRKRLLTLSQTLALKAMQTEDNQLAGLLAYHAYLINRENGGQINHPEIYRGLYKALSTLKGGKYNSLAGHNGSVKSIIFDPARNILYSADNVGVINRWGFRKENPKATTIITNEDANTCLAITIDGRWMACGSSIRTVQLFNALQPTQTPRVFDAHDGKVTNVKFIPGRNAMITSGSDNKVKHWDLLTNEGTLVYESSAGINDIDVNPNGRSVVIVTSNNLVLLWKVGSEKPTILYQHNQPVMAVSFDHEGETIAIGDRAGKILILNSSNGKIIKTVNAHTARILDIEFSPDNRLLASSGLDGVIRIWNVTDWKDNPIEIREHQSWVESIAFSPDGEYLLSSSNDGNLIYMWPIKTGLLVDEICHYIKRQLSKEEWSFYMGDDIEYREVCK